MTSTLLNQRVTYLLPSFSLILPSSSQLASCHISLSVTYIPFSSTTDLGSLLLHSYPFFQEISHTSIALNIIYGTPNFSSPGLSSRVIDSTTYLTSHFNVTNHLTLLPSTFFLSAFSTITHPVAQASFLVIILDFPFSHLPHKTHQQVLSNLLKKYIQFCLHYHSNAVVLNCPNPATL